MDRKRGNAPARSLEPYRFVDWYESREFRITPDRRHAPFLPPDFPFMIRSYSFSSAHRLVPNAHDYLEINLVHRGSGVLHVEDADYPVGAGDLMLIGNDKMHLLEPDPGGRILVVCLYFMPELICPPGAPETFRLFLSPFADWERFLARGRGALPEAQRRRVAALMREMHTEYNRHTDLHRPVILNALCEILLAVQRHGFRSGPGEWPGPARGGARDRLKPVFDHIALSYRGRITGPDLAARACLSTAYLCRVFKRATGMTLTEYILRTRADKAKELLLTTDLPVSEVAFRTGFESPSYFDRVFTRLVRMPPREFRARHKGQNSASFGEIRYSG